MHFLGSYLRAHNRGYRADLANVMAGLTGGGLVVVVMVMMMMMVLMRRRAEKSPGDVRWARGVGWRSRGATVRGGGRLVVHRRERLVVRVWQWEGR